MGEHNQHTPVIAIAGPTATGKSETAVALAQLVDGEIVCADSMQIYAGLNIGTAKPSAELLQAVPHHLYGFLDPSQRYSVAQYLHDAAHVVDDIRSRGKTAILCGGTGLYISSFIQGIQFREDPGSEAMRVALGKEFDEKGAPAIIAEIAKAEPQFAQTLHQNDKKRIVRAVELLRTTGYTIPVQNELSRAQQPAYPVYLAVLNDNDRQRLYARIERRVDSMIEQGLLDEASYVHDNRSRFLTAAQAIGYKEFFGYFEKTESLDACVERLKQATRNYAKRQLTWFRREVDAVWYDICSNPPGEVAGKIKIEIDEKKEG